MSRAVSLRNRYPINGTDDNTRIVYLRAPLNYVLDVSGNINSTLAVNLVSSISSFSTNLAPLFQEYRVLSMKLKLFKLNIMKTLNLSGHLFLIPYHSQMPGTMSDPTAVGIGTMRAFPICDEQVHPQLTWKANLDDPAESEFFPTNTALSIGLGGIYVWLDGPVSAAANLVAQGIATWKIEVRGSSILN